MKSPIEVFRSYLVFYRLAQLEWAPCCKYQGNVKSFQTTLYFTSLYLRPRIYWYTILIYLKLRNAPFTLWVRPLSLSFAQDLTWTLLNTEFIVPKVFAITSLSANQSSRYVKQHFNSTIDLIWSAIFCIIIWKLISM